MESGKQSDRLYRQSRRVSGYIKFCEFVLLPGQHVELDTAPPEVVQRIFRRLHERMVCRCWCAVLG